MKGKIFVNWDNSSLVRFVEQFTGKNDVEMVRLANLRMPGGSFVMPLGKFKAQFAEKIDVPVAVFTNKRTTDEKYKQNIYERFATK